MGGDVGYRHPSLDGGAILALTLLAAGEPAAGAVEQETVLAGQNQARPALGVLYRAVADRGRSTTRPLPASQLFDSET
jgi:hypothetical protein